MTSFICATPFSSRSVRGTALASTSLTRRDYYRNAGACLPRSNAQSKITTMCTQESVGSPAVSVRPADSVRRAILLVDHGSKRMEANEVIEEMRRLVIEQLGANAIVHIAHMELASPSIHDGFTRCVADGARHVLVIPFFLTPGRHVKFDIPRLARAAADSFPGLTHEVRPHLGVHPALVDVILERGGLTVE